MYHVEYFVVNSNGRNVSMTDYGSHGNRNNTTFSTLFEAYKHFNMSKAFTFGVCTGDRDFQTPFGRRPDIYTQIPNFAYTTVVDNFNETCPDFFFGGEPGLNIRDWDALTGNLSIVGRTNKPLINKIGWVGSVGKIPSRQLLTELSTQNSDWMDCFDVNWIGFDDSLERYTGAQYLTFQDQVTRWKYLIDVEGQGYSARTKVLMFSGRVLFIADRPWKEWWYQGLEPWVHYVPVKRDLSDLRQNFEIVDNDPDLQQKIINNSLDYARNNLRYIHAMNRWKVLIDSI